ncbi:MAG TPA: anthranilate phosphoribosyltransferase [Ornithinibacter sp.]|uniref:anthranilate phosphoribosyltransferase n=1 Tax=Ornithinibacter sp. TaxID=2862748 RepID=UPI001B6E068E|nr:anthranilate phosphoribosyltransferase [Ornithinibacter sp.]MBP6524587.1 anthranilate phosphoribosyltransferase [Dermatophilaceae bacterium]HQV81802.1 anthranilate phosphoribosyltransferase [Ornithinibacter sp.]HQW72650.1 anthranilate phosphoribosyltransferase [Ornithinibacter sp.]HQX86203.1 anthranilate phosphoribosyltransferase [Ornithinibacter sp.]HQZ08902.1 anthranilate phosphoribosyltransferase [Ornithinibacter sp.]
MTLTDPARATWPDLLTALLRREDLSTEQAGWAMAEIMSGEATPVQVAGFLVALRAKGETVAELRGIADVMLEHANRIDVPGPSIDIVGTGGDRMHSVNISTMASIVVAATGLRVVKHGNRAASSSSGSADVLEALGVSLTLAPEQVAAVAQEAGITFCFANAFHPSMRHAAVARRDLGVGTAFNALGPLTNPGQPTYAAVGVADARIAPLIAGVFAGRGRAAAVFRGDDGLDELTLATTSTVWWVRDGDVTELSLDPSDLGLELSPVEALRGGDAAHNAQVVRDLLAGEVGPVRDAVVLNAGMALATASGLGDDVSSAALTRAVDEGMRRARAAIDDGSAARLLERWVSATAAA